MTDPVRKQNDNIGSSTSPYGDGQVPVPKYGEFADRLSQAAKTAGVNAAALARDLDMTRGTFSRYWNGERLPAADALVDLASLLGVDAAWLIHGTAGPGHNFLRSVDEAEWVDVPEYDLRELGQDSRGQVIGVTPFRRDWLNRAFGTDRDLWMAKLLGTYSAADLAEGDQVILRDIRKAELQERNLVIWLVHGHLAIGRFSLTNRVTEPNGEYWVPPAMIGEEEKGMTPIARILGRPLAPIR